MNNIDLKDIFSSYQGQMINELTTNREFISHPGAKGSISEASWREMLNNYLPYRYKVDKAFVLDSNGNLSDEIDIVIYDNQYSPFLLKKDEAKYIPAESVYAVFEVKPLLNKENVSYAGSKIESVRHLYRTSAPVPFVEGVYKEKFLFDILGGILTLGCSWKPPLGLSLIKCLTALKNTGRIDLGCVLQAGGFEITYGPETTLNKSDQKNSLIFFFLKLLDKLQSLGTVPAIEISAYGHFLNW